MIFRVFSSNTPTRGDITVLPGERRRKRKTSSGRTIPQIGNGPPENDDFPQDFNQFIAFPLAYGVKTLGLTTSTRSQRWLSWFTMYFLSKYPQNHQKVMIFLEIGGMNPDFTKYGKLEPFKQGFCQKNDKICKLPRDTPGEMQKTEKRCIFLEAFSCFFVFCQIQGVIF
jgi:hypothetical protein